MIIILSYYIIENNMVAGSILPITIHQNKLYFLFGKENELEKGAPGWSDFGGGCENGESPYKTALREGGEELTGFLGGATDIAKLMKQNGGYYKITHGTYHIHAFFLEYDENLPKYYNQNHRFLWDRMDKKVLSKTRLFEKIEIKWFSIEEMENQQKEFRHFYQNIIDDLIKKKNEIREFIEKRVIMVKKHQKTRKHY
jgi:predicted NUDIX family NTP pyrophosphohydrolase